MTKDREGLNRELLRLATPAILSNLTVPLLGLCDTAVAGHLGSTAAIGAIAVGSMMMNVVFWLFGFLRMGTTGLGAEAFGMRDRGRCVDILHKSLMIGLAVSMLILLLQVPLLSLLLWLTDPGQGVADLAAQYFRICVWGVPAQLGIMAMTGWFLGMQNTRVPMVIAIGVNVVNIALNVVLGLMLGYGIAGVAMGTTVSNWIGAVASGWVCLRWIRRPQDGQEKESRVTVDFRTVAWNPERDSRVRWRRLFNVNSQLFVRSACIMAVSLTMTALGARMGEVVLAANAVMMQFFIFFSYFMDGFAFAGEAMVGKYRGASQPSLVRRSVATLMRWGVGLAVLFFAVYAAGGHWIVGLLTDRAEVVEEVDSMIGWVMLLPPLTVLAFVFDGVYIGLSRTGTMMWATIAGAALFFIINFGGGWLADNDILWLGFEAYLVVRGVWLAINYMTKQRKLQLFS